MVRSFAREAVCPSCERYVGMAAQCPYCEAESARGPFMPTLRRGILLIATLAVLALHASARLRTPPLVTTQTIMPSMNFASVRLRGRVERVSHDSRFSKGPYLAFRLADADGTVRVEVDPPAVADLLRLNAMPRAGIRLEVGGTLQYKCGQRPLLRVHSARQMQFVEQRPPRRARTPGGAHG